MAVEALTEPLLPRGRDDISTPPAHSIVVDIPAATTAMAPAHRRAINVAAAATAKYPAFPVDRDVALENASASTTAALASASSPTTPWEDRPANLPPVSVHREDAALKGTFGVDHATALVNASAPTTAALTSASPPTTSWQDRHANPAPDAVHRDAALKGPSASPPATPSPGRRANLLASLGPSRPAAPTLLPALGHPRASSSTRTYLTRAMSQSEAAPISPTEDASLSPLRGRNSPRIPRSTEVNSLAESVGGDSDDGSSNNLEMERIRRSRATSNRDRSSFRTPRGKRLYHRLGLRRRPMPLPQKDTWDKESFMYTCVLVLLVGLVAYLSTVLDGWSPYLRGIFIGIFGAATGLACIGAMALISETPDPSARHFAHIVLRLTFIVGSLAFEAAVFYLLGVVGFIVWLLVATGTILGMTYIWSVGSPESFATLVSCPGSVYSSIMGLFRRA